MGVRSPGERGRAPEAANQGLGTIVPRPFLLLCGFMTAVIKKQTDTHVTLGVHLDEAALADIVAATYDRLRRPLKVAGFRPGKAPNAVVDRELGSAAVQSEVLQAATEHSYAHAVREHDLAVVASPEVTLKKFVPYTELEYEAVAEVLPPIKLADYKQLKTKPEPVKIDQAEVDQVIDDLRKRVAKRQDSNKPAAMGDEVTFDFEGRKAGQLVPGASSKAYPLVLGSGSFIPGFEDELVGLKTGDDKTFEITFPKDYQAQELAGQPVEFKVKVQKVASVELPAANDDFAKEVGQPSLAELRADIEQSLNQRQGEQNERAFEQALINELQQGSQLTVPQSMLRGQIDKLRQEMVQSLEQQGQTIADYAKNQGKSEADVDKEIEDEARRRLELALVLTEVAKAEQIQVTREDIEAEIELLKGQYTDPQMQKELASPETREEVYNHLMASRTIAKIREYNEK